MRTFVTGATGFVGSHLLDTMLAAGDEVTALVRSPARAAGLAERGVRLVQGDLHDARALAQAAEGADAVYHVAALVGAVDEAEFLRANRDGTRHVVQAVKDASPGARLVLVSSLAAAGPAERGAPRPVDEPEQPVTMYGRSKLASERVVRESGLDWVIARPPAVYGPRDRDNFLTLFRIARFGICPVFGDGTQELSLVYAPDLAEALRLAGVTPGIGGRAYFVNHPEIVTSGDVVRQIGRVTGREVRLVPVPRALAEVALGVAGGTA
ncbi:MAG TPA: NAD-dependent epimerase/dehydratase family protein, partial [Gemmatimonadales bacterium]|nr:NAD-dependent epimerase/dehydratase family protein [Gemmatimonadales bacterium]